MKKILFTGIFFSIFIQGFGQRITGTVYDKLSQIPVRGATVFFHGSSLSTLTDRSGNFMLMSPGNGKLPIVAAGTAYQSLLLYDYPENAHVHFYLDPRLYFFGNVAIAKNARSERQARRENIRIFREQFLGASVNGSSCRILNEHDLVLRFDPYRNLLKASCGQPLIIENRSLGYRITYYLNNFELSLDSRKIECSGSYQFSSLRSLNRTEMDLVSKRRELAYFGSWMEFLRSLWSNSLDSAGYDLRNSSNKKLTYDSLVIEAHGAKFWKYKDPVTIYHYSRNRSTTIQTSDTVYFDRLGYCDTEDIDWRKTGEMSLHRFGDQLPFDYKVTGEKPDINP